MTPLEKLRALAQAKKLPQTSTVDLDLTEEKKNEAISESRLVQAAPEEQEEAQVSSSTQANATEGQHLLSSVDKSEEASNLSVPSNQDNTSNSSDHPLKMALAELESALLGKLPEFRTILRDIHSKLRSDPDCVTALNEDEIGVIVQGLIHHANVEVIAPKAAKAAKAAKKTPVSASDL